MAYQEPESEYFKIPNEICERLMLANLNGTQMALVLTVIHQTWGYKREEDQIAISQFHKFTGYTLSGIRGELTELIRRCFLIQVRPPGFREAATWKFNNDWSQWIGCYSSATEQKNSREQKSGTLPLQLRESATPVALTQCHSSGTTKETLKYTLKENPPISPKPAAEPDPVVVLFQHWQMKTHLVQHHQLTNKMRKHAQARLKTRTVDELELAIDRYETILADETGKYWLTHTWTFSEFFERREGEWLDKLTAKDWERHFLDKRQQLPLRKSRDADGFPIDQRDPQPETPEEWAIYQEIADEVESEISANRPTLKDFEVPQVRKTLGEQACARRGIPYNGIFYARAMVVREEQKRVNQIQ